MGGSIGSDVRESTGTALGAFAFPFQLWYMEPNKWAAVDEGMVSKRTLL